MDSQNAPLITKTYDFVKLVIGVVNTFPRNQRHILGERIENAALDTFELLLETFYLPDHIKKKNLQKINFSFDKLRYMIRLCYELGYYNCTKREQLTKALLELGRMTGGWRKSLENKK